MPSTMDDSHHADGPAHKKPRRLSYKAHPTTSSAPPFQQLAAMKQSQILTPPTTPPRSPHSSMPPTPARKPARSDWPTSRVHFDLHMSIHRSTSTTIDSCMSESSLWTLPAFDDDDDDDDDDNGPATMDPSSNPTHLENRWSRLLRNAASSNRDRHRARLEGDGWAFIGGRYSDDLHELSDKSAESVDDEFDVVVLARESVGC